MCPYLRVSAKVHYRSCAPKMVNCKAILERFKSGRTVHQLLRDIKEAYGLLAGAIFTIFDVPRNLVRLIKICSVIFPEFRELCITLRNLYPSSEARNENGFS